jgi:hypothetical protein
VPDITPPLWQKIAVVLTLVISISMLLILFVVAPAVCAGITVSGGGDRVCELGPGWYLFTITFILLCLYSGFKLYTMMYPDNAE